MLAAGAVRRVNDVHLPCGRWGTTVFGHARRPFPAVPLAALRGEVRSPPERVAWWLALRGFLSGFRGLPALIRQCACGAGDVEHPRCFLCRSCDPLQEVALLRRFPSCPAVSSLARHETPRQSEAVLPSAPVPLARAEHPPAARAADVRSQAFGRPTSRRLDLGPATRFTGRAGSPEPADEVIKARPLSKRKLFLNKSQTIFSLPLVVRVCGRKFFSARVFTSIQGRKSLEQGLWTSF